MRETDSRLAFLGRDCLVYEEGGSQIDVTIDYGTDTVVVFPVSIGRWRQDPMRTISDAERQRIVENIKRLLEARHLKVELK